MIHNSEVWIQEIISRRSVKENFKYMRGKYITNQILLACLSKARAPKKGIHALLEETIAERKRILKLWEQSFFGTPSKDIHALLRETIAERKRILLGGKNYFSLNKTTVI